MLKDNSVITTVWLQFSFSVLVACLHYFIPNAKFIAFSQLELSYNPIGPDGAKALAEILKFHGNVNTLKLGWCQVRYITSKLFYIHWSRFSLFMKLFLR